MQKAMEALALSQVMAAMAPKADTLQKSASQQEDIAARLAGKNSLTKDRTIPSGDSEAGIAGGLTLGG